MHLISFSDPRILRSLTCKVMLGTCWFFGLLLGMYAAANAGDSFLLTMRGDLETVSIPGLLITLLPFLLTAFAVSLPHPGFLLPLVLSRAFVYSYSAYGLAIVFRGAAWLARILLMFSRMASVPLLMWLWLRKCDYPDSFRMKELAVCGAAVVLIAVLDYCVVSPFAAALL